MRTSPRSKRAACELCCYQVTDSRFAHWPITAATRPAPAAVKQDGARAQQDAEQADSSLTVDHRPQAAGRPSRATGCDLGGAPPQARKASTPRAHRHAPGSAAIKRGMRGLVALPRPAELRGQHGLDNAAIRQPNTTAGQAKKFRAAVAQHSPAACRRTGSRPQRRRRLAADQSAAANPAAKPAERLASDAVLPAAPGVKQAGLSERWPSRVASATAQPPRRPGAGPAQTRGLSGKAAQVLASTPPG